MFKPLFAIFRLVLGTMLPVFNALRLPQAARLFLADRQHLISEPLVLEVWRAACAIARRPGLQTYTAFHFSAILIGAFQVALAVMLREDKPLRLRLLLACKDNGITGVLR